MANNSPSTWRQWLDTNSLPQDLGYHVAGEALRPQLFDGWPPDNLTFPFWFRTLADKLLSD